jgi:hypothetical protein
MTAHAHAIQSMASSKDSAKDKPSSAVNPWADLWAGWTTATVPEKKHANPFEDMMASVLQMQIPQAPKEEPRPSPSFDEMMEKGREMQLQYLASLQSIFSDAWKTDSSKS